MQSGVFLPGTAMANLGSAGIPTVSVAPDPIDKSTQIRFLTCDHFPQLNENFQIWFGASVSARSIKLINASTTERDTWWEELRKEIEKNALSVDCTHIIGYRETLQVYSPPNR